MRPQSVTATAAGVTPWLRLNRNERPFKTGLFTLVSSDGSMTYSVEYTYDDPMGEYPTDFQTDADWRVVDDMSALTANGVGNLFYPVNCVRLNVSAFTSGTVKLTATQADAA